MKIAIIQPTPFRKGHYYIYTKSLFNEIRNSKYKVNIISAFKIYKNFKKENKSILNFNIYSFQGLIIYLFLCYSTIFRFIFSRKKYNRVIILDCEYSCVSIFLIILKTLGWRGKITIQVNAPNFVNSFSIKRFNVFKILKLIQTFIFKSSLKLFDIKISCLGLWHKNLLSKQLSFNKKNILVIEDGGGGIVKKIPEKKLIYSLNKESINFPKSNKKIFLLFGNIRKDKGHLFLTSIWNRFFNSSNDPYLWIVGHDEENLSKKILEDSSNNIVLHNSYVPIDLIKNVYQKADFAILPYLSLYSGGSGPLMKGAFTHSKLAIVSNVSEMGRLAKEEKLAEYFISEDSQSLVSCIRKVLGKKDGYYADKIDRALRYANERDWSNLSQKFIESLK